MKLIIQVENSCIIRTHWNLLCLKHIYHCINACSFTKQKQLYLYQACFDLVYLTMKQDIKNLSITY